MREPEPINVREYEEGARARLARTVYDYYAGGALDEITLAENHRAFDRIQLLYRVLRDVSSRELSTTLLGHRVELPVIAAPTAFHGMAHTEGEVATVRGVGAAGTLMVVSTLSNRPIEEVVAAATRPVFFQLYVYKDREATRDLVARAEAAGCAAIVLTVDGQIWGQRERDARNDFRLPEGLEMTNLVADKKALPRVEGSGLAAYAASMFDPALSWEDVEWLVELTDLPVVVKGVAHPEDAALSVEHGARAVWVSNHGGRQVDTAPATVELLEEIATAVDGRVEIVLDGGVRRGSDVLKALALGARVVAVGRPVLWALAVGGAAGVERCFALLREELDRVLGLCGARSVAEVGPELLRLPRRTPR